VVGFFFAFAAPDEEEEEALGGLSFTGDFTFFTGEGSSSNSSHTFSVTV
jgi:hypothetical protein